MAVSDSRQRVMPTMDDRNNGDPLAYPEAVLLTNPANEKLRGEVFLPFISEKVHLISTHTHLRL